MAGVPGLEPGTTESKSVVLPLHHTPTKMNCSLAPSELSLVFRHTEPDFLVSRLQRHVTWDTRPEATNLREPSGSLGVEPTSALHCVKFRTSQQCVFLLLTLQTWSG